MDEVKKVVCALVVVMISSGAWGAVDIDLSKFSTVMAYSGLFNVLADPYAYVGKVIKLKGTFDVFHDDDTDTDYFGVIVMDQSACCAVGLDFVLRGTNKYPDDYPEIGAIITVSGTFAVEREGEDVFCRLDDAVIM